MGEEFDVTRSLEPGASAGRRAAPGTLLRGRYRLERELGRGGMGVVYRATDTELQREVAVKVLPEAASSPEARERLLREARAAAALNHPHIVAVYDVGEDRGLPFLVMELVEGTHLGQAPPAGLPQVVETACRICDALAHAHEHGIVHRDLKPENVLLAGATAAVKLADLGLAVTARESERITAAGSILGTVSYMAPEQALGVAVDGRADLYALGVMLYELVTGRLPFSGGSALEVVSQHVHAPVVPPSVLRPGLPAALEAAILRLLAKDPGERFDDARAARAALEAAAGPGAAEGAAEEGPSAGTGASFALLDALSRGRLVGRERELAEARELWRRARAGSGRAVLFSGEPGAGKTRLARELMLQAALDGALVMSGACYEYEAATPYLPFVEAFRRWVREEDSDERLRAACGDGAPFLAQLAPEVERRLGPFPPRAGLAPHEERLLFFDSVAQALISLADARGLLFYVDDLHWADGGSLWLLGHLLRRLRPERVLFLASYRETELDRAHPLSKALDDWNRERLATRIVLRRFGPEETRAQLAALLGQAVSEEFAGMVHQETEGNPFFVEEVLKALIEQGVVRRESGRWKRDESSQLVLPQSVKATIGGRLDRVGPECNEVLRSAAVLGKTFTFAELAAVAGDRGEDALLDALDEAASAQLLIAGRDESFAFTHDKIREVLHEELNPIRRRKLHHRTAEGLEGLRGKAPVAIEKLAHHFIEGGDMERGLDYARQAAAQARQVHAWEEAAAAYGRALECAEALGRREEEAELEEAIGSVLMAGGDLAPAIARFEKALALAGDARARARLRCQAANACVTLGDDRGLDHLRAARAELDPSTHPVETAHALAIEARFHHLQGRHRRAVELLEQAAALCVPPRTLEELTPAHASALTDIFTYLAGAYQHLGLFDVADVWARRAMEFGREFRVPAAEMLGYEFLGEHAACRGEWAEGLEYAARERELASRLRARVRIGWTHFIAALCAWLMGTHERAERESLEGTALAEATGERRLRTLLLGCRALALASMGRTDEALELARQELEEAESLGLVFLRTDARQSLAEVHRSRGEYEEGIRRCEEIQQISANTESIMSRLLVGPAHVEMLLAAGRREEARACLAAWAELVARCQSPHFAREAERLRALLA